LTITGAHNTDYDPQIQFRDGAAPAVRASMGVDGATNNLTFNRGTGGVGGSVHWTMDSAGRVGMGQVPQANFLLALLWDRTDDNGIAGLDSYVTHRSDTSGLFTTFGLKFRMRGYVDNGETNTGTMYGIQGQCITLGTGTGTLTNLVGCLLEFGGYSGGTHATNKYGLYLLSYRKSGNTTNHYDIYIAAPDGIIAPTADWCIYSDHAAPCRFIDDIRIDADSKSILFGAGQDSGIYDNGARMICDVDLLTAGSRSLNIINGDVGIGLAATTAPQARMEVLQTSNVLGDSRETARFSDDTAMDAGVGGGISFTGKYKAAGDITRFAAIWGEKENAVEADFDGQLHLGTRVDGGTISSDLIIDSAGDVDVIGDFTAGTIQADDGFTGNWTNNEGDTVTVVGGIITDVS